MTLNSSKTSKFNQTFIYSRMYEISIDVSESPRTVNLFGEKLIFQPPLVLEKVTYFRVVFYVKVILSKRFLGK